MDKNEYWNEKDNERYQKMKAEINFNELDFKGAKKLAKVTKGIAKTFVVIVAIIGICALIIAFLYIKGQWQYIGSRVDPDVIENLEATYREKFKIVSKEINDTEEIYKISPSLLFGCST